MNKDHGKEDSTFNDMEVTMKFVLPKGTKALPVDFTKNKARETELLVARNTQMEITRAVFKNGRWFLNLKVISQANNVQSIAQKG
jgi:hypothetical protein